MNPSVILTFLKSTIQTLTILILFMPILPAQDKTISGTVLDQNREALIGANIQVENTSNGTVSDVDGTFSLTLTSSDSFLIVSYIGYTTQRVELGTQSSIEIILELSDVSLGEVVVIGYGTRSKATLTTAVTDVDAEPLQTLPVAGAPMRAMIGKVAGLNIVQTDGRPFASPAIWIRGGTSPSPTNDRPLYVIDGYVIGNDPQDIDFSDVENITVLKDAASTAIYGARAANGVIVITTKRGKMGKAKVSFSYGHEITDLEQSKFDFAAPEDEIYFARLASMNDGRLNNLTRTNWWQSTSNAGDTRYTLRFEDELKAENNGSLPEGYIVIEDPFTGRNITWKPFDWQDLLFRNGSADKYALNLNGGTENARYNVGLSYYDNQGSGVSIAYERFNLSSNTDFKLSDKLRLGTFLSYQIVGLDAGGQDANQWYRRSGRLPTVARYKRDDGTLHPGRNGKRNPDYYIQNIRQSANFSNSFRLSTELEYEIIPGLKLKPFIALRQVNIAAGQFIQSNEIDGNTRRVSGSNETGLNTQFDATLDYTKSFRTVHNFNFLAGTSFINGYDYDLSATSLGAGTDLIPTINAAVDEEDRATSTLTKTAIQSWFGRINYDFARKYLFGVSLRYDGAYNFSENNKFGLFPGISLGWNIHQEDFWNISAIDALKLRGSWGFTGRQDVSIFDTQGRYSTTAYAGSPGVLNTTLPNLDLVWETTRSFDFGVDFSILDYKINGTIDYYAKKTFDRLYSKDLPGFTGFSSIRENFGTWLVNGLELAVNTTPVATKDFRWNLGFNVSFVDRKVGELPENGNPKNRDGGTQVADPKTGETIWVLGLAEGERPDAIYGWIHDGVLSTTAEAEAYNAIILDEIAASGRQKRSLKEAGDRKWKDLNGDGLINNLDRGFLGYKLPDKTGGMSNSFSYKGIELLISLDFALGHHIWDEGTARLLSQAQGEDRPHALITKSWQNEGDKTDYPRYIWADNHNYRNYNRVNNSFFVSKGNYLAFRAIQLTYNVPKRLLDKVGITGLKINLAGHNLGWITTYEGRSPEHVDGEEDFTYPIPRTFNFGANLQF